MSPPVKFRAFDRTTGEMLRVDCLQLDPAFDQKFGVGIFDEHNDFHPMSDIDLIRPTGLHDINGLEIWEGDVIESVCSTELDRYAPVRDVVVFESGMWTGERYAMRPIFDRWRVIGNRFEQPELLTKEQTR